MPRLRFSLSLLIFASACGGYAKPTQSPSRSAPAMDMDDAASESEGRSYVDSEQSLSPRERISMLHNQIGDLRTGSGLAREPMSRDVVRAHSDPAPVSPTSVKAGSPTSAESGSNTESDTCRATCTLKTSICSNSTKICNLASELGGDEWADEKCDSSKVSCTEATTSCDECS